MRPSVRAFSCDIIVAVVCVPFLPAGPLWALAFLVAWFPWSMDGNSWLAAFHFLTSLCLFDTFLTYVCMVQCAMLCDVTVENRERNKLNQFNSLGQISGSVLILAAYWFWNRDDLAVFRGFCICVAGNTW